MICPRCATELQNKPSECPSCGLRLVRTVSGVMKTSAVLIAAGDEQGFYRSVQEVPEPLRTQLIETTNSANSGTIVIADSAGKEQITQNAVRRVATDVDMPPEPQPAPRFRFLGMPWAAWVGIVLVTGAIAFSLAVFGFRF